MASAARPIAWKRAAISGILGASLMMGLLDTFFMMGVTTFSYERYIGSLLLGGAYRPEIWIVGLLANWAIGALFGMFYAGAFEFGFYKAGGRAGSLVGFAHALIAACAFFPVFNLFHEEAGTGVYPNFGFFGSGLGAPTSILLLMGHLLFGVTAGILYGPVRAHRFRAEEYEPGEQGFPGEPNVMLRSEDHEDSDFVYAQGG
jgi:hypothetical protein